MKKEKPAYFVIHRDKLHYSETGFTSKNKAIEYAKFAIIRIADTENRVADIYIKDKMKKVVWRYGRDKNGLLIR